MKRTYFQWLALVLLMGLAAVPASATLEWCEDMCSPISSCDEICIAEDFEGNIGFSTCGDYGECDYSPPPCQDPKRVTTRVETTQTSSTVTGIWCHTDHWFPFDPYAWPRLYEYTAFTYRHDTIRTTEFCNGTQTEEIISSTTSGGSCARRTWSYCSFPFGPPPLTCAF